MNTKALSSRTNSKKIIFNKHKNVIPELIPIHAKEPIKNSFAKKTPKPIEEIPEIVFSFIPKPPNICQNDNCQNLNINDDELGRGYCSSKCVVEHSKTLFNCFLKHRKLQNQNLPNCNRDLSLKHKSEPSINYSNSSQIDEDLLIISPTKAFDLPDNFRVDDKAPFNLHSPIKSFDFQSVNTIAKPQNSELCNESIEITDDELEIFEPRESFFNIVHKVIFPHENTRNIIENNAKIISSKKKSPVSKKNSKINSLKNDSKKPVKKSSPDVIFVSLHKKRPKIAKQTENFETIVID